MRIVLLFGAMLMIASLQAQRILLVEKVNSARTLKLYEGDYIRYRLVDEKIWREAHIYGLREDIQALVLDDRYVQLDDIAMMRRSRSGIRAIGTMLMVFGVSWSGFALVGTATDGDPDTRYQVSDALVTATSAGAGFLLTKCLGNKRMRIGGDKKYRLRIVDITF